MKRVLWAMAYVLGWAMLAGSALAVWLHFYPSRGQVALYLTSGVAFAIIPAVVAVLVFASLRRWIMLAVAVITTGVLVYTQIPLLIAADAPDGEEFTVVSANLLFGGADPAALEALVAEVDPEVVSLQEVTPEAYERLRSGELGRRLPHEFAVPGPTAVGTALFSKQPLSATRTVPGTVLHNLAARTDLPGAASAHVLAVHPAAPLWNKRNDWAADMDTLAAYFASLAPGPVIALGDYNSTWNHAKYRRLLTNGLVDGADVAGAGFKPTFPTDSRIGNRPLVAIDRIVMRGFVATAMETRHLPGSDHRSLVVTLVAS